MKLVGDPSYPELIKTMVPAFSGVLGVIHVNFPAELDAFDQPVTSVTLVTTKTAEANEKVLKLLGEMSELSKGKIHVGQTVESLTDTEGDNVVLVTAGWENVEVSDSVLCPATADLFIYHVIGPFRITEATPSC